MTFTNHGEARMKERMGVGKSSRKLERVAKNALERGYAHNSTKGSLRKYLDDKLINYGVGDNMRIYAGQLFVFEGDVLITVFGLPGRFQRGVERYIAS